MIDPSDRSSPRPAPSSGDREEPAREAPAFTNPDPQDLPVWLRISLIVLGVVLLAVGVAGLVLPGLQGILTILLGLALLSLVSHSAHRFLIWCLGPWPKLLQRVERQRGRMFRWMNRQLGSVGTSAVGAEEAAAEVADQAEPDSEPDEALRATPASPEINLRSHHIGPPRPARGPVADAALSRTAPLVPPAALPAEAADPLPAIAEETLDLDRQPQALRADSRSGFQGLPEAPRPKRAGERLNLRGRREIHPDPIHRGIRRRRRGPRWAL